MKSDDQVLAEATVIVENQWCQTEWESDTTDAEGRLRYCAVGAVMKAADFALFGEITEDEVIKNSTEEQIEQVCRVSERLKRVIVEQYPDVAESLKNRNLYNPTWWVEIFNDTHTREEMLAVFEKAAAE